MQLRVRYLITFPTYGDCIFHFTEQLTLSRRNADTDAAMSYWEYIYSLTAATPIVFHASSFKVDIVTEILTSSKYCHTLMLDQSY